MGQRLITALEAEAFSGVILGYDRDIPEKGSVCATLTELFEHCDVVIDFSGAGLFPEIMHAAAQHPKPLIVGTTGVEESLLFSLNALAESVPVVFAPNTSLGGVIQRWVAKKLAGLLPENYDIDIIETHHRHKKDTPSGTAMALAGAIAGVKKQQGISLTLGGGTSPRENDRIEMHALRCGNIPGKHEVVWTSLEERIVIEHQVFSPHLFATGVVSILKWLSDVEKPGLYTMEHVLGLDS
jgi:4-hydroxy-tetrahydrodipicolinate reductase